MLNYFNKIVVPDVPHVDLYQDDENPAKFWMVPQLPRAATGVDGKPDVALFAFARDLSLIAGVKDPLPAGETEGGRCEHKQRAHDARKNERSGREQIHEQHKLRHDQRRQRHAAAGDPRAKRPPRGGKRRQAQ